MMSASLHMRLCSLTRRAKVYIAESAVSSETQCEVFLSSATRSSQSSESSQFHPACSVKLLCWLWLAATFLFLPVSDAQLPLTESIKSKVADPSNLAGLEKSLLQMFGFSERPKTRRGSNLKVPPYLLKLYEDHVRGGSSRSGMLYSRHPTYSADIIRSFMQLEADENADNVDGFVLNFNTSSLQASEGLQAAELRFLCQTSRSINSSSPLRVQVYDILNPGNERQEIISRLLDTRVCKDRRVGRDSEVNGVWESLDVTPAVMRWLAQPQRNHGLHVRLVSSHDDVHSNEHLKRVRLKRSLETGDQLEQWPQEQPALVTYSVDAKNKDTRSNKKNRTRRNPTRRSNRNRVRKRARCRRKELYVDFTEVGWDNWIIAPPGYQAYYCSGECPAQLQAHMNASNHAIVQNLINSVNSQAVPRPCCVATDLSPISILYEDEDIYTIKVYENMVVEGCGCR